MNVLSLTFHAVEHILPEWEKYVDDTLVLMAENLLDADRYILSEVQTDMVNEGKNYNLLLMFENEELINQFLESELVNIEERLETKFGSNVMVFKTLLNPKKFRL